MSLPDSNSDNEWDREQAEEEADRIRRQEPPPALDASEFLAWRSPKRPSKNPTQLDNPLWEWLVRTRWSAHSANERLAGPSPFDAGPMWCFDRFGMTETALPDGRVVYIAGEHEDHYDPDFFIYNDITVVDRTGAISIFGYPEADFPPTDFHSATLVDQSIFIIGRLGYPEGRDVHSTPVYKLSLDSMVVERANVSGDMPGWIYRHTASLNDDGATITVRAGEQWLGNDRAASENIDSWSFDTRTGEWHRLTQHAWQRWTMRRVDRKPNRIWDTRQFLWNQDHAHLGLEIRWPYDTAPDLAALKMLYRITDEGTAPTEGVDAGTYTVIVDGVTVRFREDRFWVEAIVEGQLAEQQLSRLQTRTLALLERIDAAPYMLETQADDRRA